MYEIKSCAILHKIESCAILYKIESCAILHKSESYAILHKIESCAILHKIESYTILHKISHTLIRQSQAPLQLLARSTRTLSDSGVRQDRQVLPGRAKSSEREERGDPLPLSPQRELRFSEKIRLNLLHFCTKRNKNISRNISSNLSKMTKQF